MFFVRGDKEKYFIGEEIAADEGFPSHNGAYIAEIAHVKILVREVYLQLSQHILIAYVILMEVILVGGIAVYITFRDIFHEDLFVLRQGFVLSVVFQDLGHGTFAMEQRFHLMVDSPQLLVYEGFDGLGIAAVQRLAYLLQRHAVILHVLYHIQTCGHTQQDTTTHRCGTGVYQYRQDALQQLYGKADK